MKNLFSIKNIIAYIDSLMALFDQINTYAKDIYPYTIEYTKTVTIKSKEKMIEFLPNFLLNDIIQMGYCNQEESLAISTALIEALSNSLYHGNFEIDSDIRNLGSLSNQKKFKDEVKRRENLLEYYNRNLIIKCICDQNKIEFTIIDEGLGFNTEKYENMDFNDIKDFKMFSGKGMFLMKSLVDEVFYNKKGNIITLIKYHKIPQKD